MEDNRNEEDFEEENGHAAPEESDLDEGTFFASPPSNLAYSERDENESVGTMDEVFDGEMDVDMEERGNEGHHQEEERSFSTPPPMNFGEGSEALSRQQTDSWYAGSSKKARLSAAPSSSSVHPPAPAPPLAHLPERWVQYAPQHLGPERVVQWRGSHP
uniref:Uncharacterized protein n=1 Tax=Chromera velia CCMP2878 TaxID=1169474 RepID=A0A0G4FMU1_9ALVE|eukprot:Cvel_17832.t1-p1 / transcript=Cvel_17832.t1 / gene=Cvel_17832 / organism=Chromera_velia_CCMP2878 / gene_product=hypothetical protein / transcript_product=hypothetical protein / location=Cvel_scaffold1445:43020-43493(+) / protein_length=158 / sequence_SO=supercontig / SO=protein_coding / is_pseudo=false